MPISTKTAPRPTAFALPDLAVSARLASASLPATGPSWRDVPPLVFDLSQVKAPTAAGLGELVALHNRLRGMGGRLVLTNVSALAYRVFAATNLTRLLDVRRGEA